MRKFAITIFLAFACAAVGKAQAVLSPRNMALGGGGSTYITDYNANFYNPANLMIQDKYGTIEIGAGLGGFYFNSPVAYSSPQKQLSNFRDHTKRYKDNRFSFDAHTLHAFTDDNYKANTHISEHHTRYDVTLLGVKWRKENRAYSIALRSRTSSLYQVGKGWYDDEFVAVGNHAVLNRSLTHRYQTLHEISFGYAETFRFMTNLTSRLDNFIIGIAPKLVFGGAYQDASWHNLYYQNSQGQYSRVHTFYYAGAGQIGQAASGVLAGQPVQQAVSQHIDDNPFRIDGVGAGLDIGITYLLTLGSDLSAVRPDEYRTQKSLRLSFAMTDIGFVAYTEHPLNSVSEADTVFNPVLPTQTASQIFAGTRMQYVAFLKEFGESDPFAPAQESTSAFSVLLPMALHGGALLELHRVKLMGDVSIGLTDNAFNSTKLTSSFGIELRPLMFLPLRAGTRFHGHKPEFLSLGTAIETKYWNFAIAAQFAPKSLISKIELSGISMATLQFHF